jgi:DNA-binding MarR family transcriptional regulator
MIMINQLNDRVLSVRNFNRFYTNYIGLLDQHMLYDPFSLIEARVLFEIAHTENCTAKLLRDLLAIDRGYVSCVLLRKY